MPTIRVLVPEAYALDHQGRQLDRLVIKNARSRQDMEPQLSTFIQRWSLPQGHTNHSIPTRSNPAHHFHSQSFTQGELK